ncbi:hypothetical protein EMIHUDRAFT_234141 [Emiliania huxleyi CCMP1516]|uniref:Uncharacterized protein n=2 Tax=Emiliania huxleyi TaxID=2903 RepID=A0A0D3JZY4_EMIH1|nr:hypothetical protein EMIHUDRAFT_234141 [Emiliania huxleyi CCMP1516]EOD29069.1 hypothetical protein EMIHUDRAFT_234141 [Emiliania huxleyi CCMP1516]|eukprot:XP_005781498.1 hypothetical protein EMIHUDRAFT_234141 [Emiliania huxleyi CCMP1516]
MNTLQHALLYYRAQQELVCEVLAKSSWVAPAHKHAKEGTDIVALALAAFMRYAAGTDASGEPLELVDPLTDALRPIAATRAFVETIFGAEVAGWEAFVSNVFEHADRSHRSTVRGIVRAEKEECEARLKELCKTDELLTSRSEKAAAATSSAEAPASAN